ncbi:bifunctional acetaldehyde-CoA/alcohol dehydrogenase, partial [Vitellibacter sp. q18]|nr:bifunctional acetaldehyde-CoA/alcohol dehydrogenase [Aequorivita lutea]
MTDKTRGKEEQIATKIDQLVSQAEGALEGLKQLDQETIDTIVKEMALAGLDQHMPLAKLAIEETGRGVFEDKAIKNIFATEYIYHNIKYNKTV